jgi:hypothetical protein
MTAKQKLRKLQLAIDHLDDVQFNAPEVRGELSQAIDLIHQAESQIEDAA